MIGDIRRVQRARQVRHIQRMPARQVRRTRPIKADPFGNLRFEPHPAEASRINKTWRWAFVVSAIIMLLTGVIQAKNYFNEARINSLVKQARIKAYSLTHSVDYSKLQNDLQVDVSGYPDATIGVSVIDLNSGEQLGVNQNTSFNAASTTKVLTAAAFLKAVENGRQSLTEPVGAYTADYQIRQMVNRSNNDSWNLLASELGSNQVGAYASSIGLKSFNESGNIITPADESLLLQKLYAGQLLNPEHTKLLLGYMQNTNEEGFIPAALPYDATVEHKYGLLDEYMHDAAIINYHGRTIILTIYTKGGSTSDYDARSSLTHRITRTVMSDLTN